MEEKKKEGIVKISEAYKPVNRKRDELNQKLKSRQLYIAQLAKLEKGTKLAQKERLSILRIFSDAQAQGIRLITKQREILESTIKAYNDTALSTKLSKEQ